MLTKTERQTVAAIIKARRCRALFRETPSDWYFGKAAIAVGCRRMGKAVPQPGTAQARLRNLAAKGIIHRVERNRALYAFTDLGLGIVFALEGEGVAL